MFKHLLLVTIVSTLGCCQGDVCSNIRDIQRQCGSGTAGVPLTGRFCSIVYEGICYRVIGRFSRSVRYNHFDAISECRSVGGELTHVVDKTHYDMIWNWVRSQHSGTVWMWLGMYHRSGRVVLANGQPAPYVRWHSGFPKRESSRTKMGMRVEIGPAQHMFNDPDHYTLGNALCRIG